MAGRLTAIRDANGNVARLSYNSAGDLLSLVDGKEQTTTWNYDSVGRMTGKVDTTGSNILWLTYDANDRVTSRATVAKGTTVFSWDANANLTNVDYPLSTDIRLKYDALDRLTNLVDEIGTSAFTYTPAGLLQSEDGPWANDTISYGYNNNLQRTTLSLLQPGIAAWSQSYAYDSARRLQTLTSGAGSFGYQYVGGSRLIKKLSLPNSSYITNAFDAVGQLTGTWLKKNTHAILNYHGYGYDQWGQRTNQVRTSGDRVDYRYDAFGQLKQALGFEPDGLTPRWHEKFGYSYDAANNLAYRTNDQLVASFTANTLNQLSSVGRSGSLTVRGTSSGPATEVTVNGSNAIRYADHTFASTNHPLVSGTNIFTAIARDMYGRVDTNTVTTYLPESGAFLYDRNGNLLSDGAKGFEYDDENQLLRVTATNSWKSEFSYDGLLRRRITKEYTWTGSAWSLTNEIRYVCDGMLVLQERDGNNTPKVTYTRGPDLSSTFEGVGGIGGLLARTESGSSAFYHNDGSGNVTALVDSQQFLAAQYLYDPFGNMLSMSGPLAEANTYRFSSKEAHVNSGLYYYGYRYYSPNLQRWINEDPIAEDGDINIHRFVFNDPVNWIDVDGLNGYNVPRPSPRPGYRGPITEELSGHIRRGSGRLTREEQFYENAMRHQWEKELARRHPGHKPGQTYICAPSTPAKRPGSRGSPETQKHLDEIRDQFLQHYPQFEHTHGGRRQTTGERLKEEYISGPLKARRGSLRPDLTFTDPSSRFTVRINTVDTTTSGRMTQRELDNFAKLLEHGPAMAVPKCK